MDNITNAQRARVLVQALPYIQQYTGKIIVVKYGGSAMTDESLKADVMQDLILLSLVGIKVVLVHGGGPEITQMLKRLGIESRFENGLRVTDEKTAQVATMVLAGKVNKSLVSLIENKGGRAIGVAGMDGHMIEAKKKDAALGFVGEITKINPQPIIGILEMGYIPVIATVGCDNDGNVYNINADTAAAKIAGALDAECLISMTDTVGVLADVNDPSTLLREIHTSDIPKLISDGIISGGMIPKAECCVDALTTGVRKVFIIDGRVPHSILIETLTNEGIGTMFTDG